MSAVTYAETVANHVRAQARDALANGMGMEAFMAWAARYTSQVAGLEPDIAANIVVPAWTEAYDDWRDDEIANT